MILGFETLNLKATMQVDIMRTDRTHQCLNRAPPPRRASDARARRESRRASGAAQLPARTPGLVVVLLLPCCTCALAVLQSLEQSDPIQSMLLGRSTTYIRSVLMISIQNNKQRSNIPEPLLTFTSKCPLKVNISQGQGPLFQIKLLKTGHMRNMFSQRIAHAHCARPASAWRPWRCRPRSAAALP